MDKQKIFFLVFALFMMCLGVLRLNIILQLFGITLMVFMVFDVYFDLNKKDNSKDTCINESKLTIPLEALGLLRYTDIILGILILIRYLYGIIPFFLIFIFTLMISIKAAPFVSTGDIASILDIFSIFIIFSSFGLAIPGFIIVGISIYFIQKGILSFY